MQRDKLAAMEVCIPLEAVSAVGESSEVSQITSGVATCNTGIVHPLVLVTIFTVPKVKIPLWVLKPDKRTSTDSFFHDSEIKSSFPTRSTELVTVQSVHVQELPNCLEYTIFCHSYKSVGVQLARIVVEHSL